jgi:hypothetical protein
VWQADEFLWLVDRTPPFNMGKSTKRRIKQQPKTDLSRNLIFLSPEQGESNDTKNSRIATGPRELAASSRLSDQLGWRSKRQAAIPHCDRHALRRLAEAVHNPH